jgi:hypothetical protein
MKALRPAVLLPFALLVALPCLAEQVAAPILRPDPGPMRGAQMTISFDCATSGATIFYTTNGSEPSPSSTKYTGGFTISQPTTIKARAYKFGLTESRVVSGIYTKAPLGLPPGAQATARPGAQVERPVLSPKPESLGPVPGEIKVKASCATSGAVIRFTTDNSDPTASSNVIPAELKITGTLTLKVRAFKQGMTDSPIVSGTYRISPLETVARPSLSPAPESLGPVPGEVKVKASCATSGAVIRFTTDNSDPIATSRVFPAEMKISGTLTLKVRAFKPGLTDSPVVTGTYRITPLTGGLTPEERKKSEEECAKILSLQREIEKIKADRAARRKNQGLDPDLDCRNR